MLKIGSLTLSSPFLQAPMAGMSNDAWRRILLKFGGVGLLAAEMMHARGSLEMERRRKVLHGRLFGLPLREDSGSRPSVLPQSQTDTASLPRIQTHAGTQTHTSTQTSTSTQTQTGVHSQTDSHSPTVSQTRTMALPIPVPRKASFAENPFKAARIPLAVQIWDNQPEPLEEFAEKLILTYDIQTIDMNFGCPAHDVVQKAHCGSWLLQFPDQIGELASAVVRAAKRASETLNLPEPIPVTAKMRLGLSADRLTYLEVAQTLESAGVSAVTVHGRTTRQMYSGEADWDKIAEVKAALKIPVIGNGDIRTPHQAVSALKTYGVDGVMIGRAALNEPWLFRQAFALWQGLPEEEALQRPSAQIQKELLLEHFDFLLDQHGPKEAVILMRKYAPCYGIGMKNARKFRVRVTQASTVEEFLNAVEEFFPMEENP